MYLLIVSEESGFNMLSDHPSSPPPSPPSEPLQPTNTPMMDNFSIHNYSIDLPICRICHCGDGDTDSFHKGSTKSNLNKKSSSPPFTLSTLGSPSSELLSNFSSTSSTQSTSTSSSPSSTPSEDNSTHEMNLITPCCCSGSLKYVHHYCLQQWIRSSNNKYCELCKYHFKMSIKFRPFHKWERLEMSNSERRKLLYNLLFNLISMFCVFWSIYVLIERATYEAKFGLLDWPFWTKMLVVSIGFLGGTIFLFVQLRLYISILTKWRQYNRVIVIHNCDNEKTSPSTLSSPLPPCSTTTIVTKTEKKPSFELDLSGIK